jgi:hypothetical protein
MCFQFLDSEQFTVNTKSYQQQEMTLLFSQQHRISPFIGGLRCQAIQTKHSPYIAERTQKAVYIVRCLCANPATQTIWYSM